MPPKIEGIRRRDRCGSAVIFVSMRETEEVRFRASLLLMPTTLIGYNQNSMNGTFSRFNGYDRADAWLDRNNRQNKKKNRRQFPTNRLAGSTMARGYRPIEHGPGPGATGSDLIAPWERE
jgi:hypothetical protein